MLVACLLSLEVCPQPLAASPQPPATRIRLASRKQINAVRIHPVKVVLGVSDDQPRRSLNISGTVSFLHTGYHALYVGDALLRDFEPFGVYSLQVALLLADDDLGPRAHAQSLRPLLH